MLLIPCILSIVLDLNQNIIFYVLFYIKWLFIHSRLAHGCLSPRKIYWEVKKYEKERTSNNSTYWVIFELIWRDYFKFVGLKYGNRLFHSGGKYNLTFSQQIQFRSIYLFLILICNKKPKENKVWIYILILILNNIQVGFF